MKFHIDTGSNISHTCTLCGKRMKKNIYPFSYMDEEIFHWWVFFHYLFKHGIGDWKVKTIIKHIFILILTISITAITAPIKLICLPFWLLYEYVL